MATPARSTRSRGLALQPLPVTSTIPSSAYGARGSPLLGRQLGVTGADVTDMIAPKRSSRQASREASAEPPKARGRGKKAAARAPPVVEEEEDREESQAPSDDPPASGLGTVVDAGAPYEQRPPARVSPARANERVDEPTGFSVLLHTSLRALDTAFTGFKRVFFSMAALFTLLSLLTVAASLFFGMNRLPTPGLMIARERITRGLRLIVGLPEWEQPPAGIEKEWIFFKHYREFRPGELPDYNVPDLQWTININLVGRLERLEKKTDDIAAALNEVKTDMASLLPRMVVVDKVDGELRITEELYTALQQRLHGDESLWNAYLDSNQQRIDDTENERLRLFFEGAESKQHIVSASTALDMIRSENSRLVELFEKNTASERAAFVQDIRNIAEEAVNDVLAKNTAPNQDLAKEFFVQNTLDQMQNLNFFSPKAGAKVVERLTSPSSKIKQPNWLAWAWYEMFGYTNPPVTALLSWAEYADSWCAAESTERGKAQIAITTHYEVVPSELIVEHIPASGTPYTDVAPHDIELWMNAGSVDAANSIHELVSQSPRYKGAGSCSDAPLSNYVCVGKGEYNIHAKNWVQKLPVFTPLEEYNLKSKDWIVRVTSNWGGDFTCIYRLRLHGTKG